MSVLDTVHGAVRPLRSLVNDPLYSDFDVDCRNGQKVHVVTYGNRATATWELVFVHGYTALGLLYIDLFRNLAHQGCFIVAPDVPGHGSSAPMENHGQDMRAYAETLAEVVQMLGMEEAYVGGHSMGGQLSLYLALMLPMAGWFPQSAITGQPWDHLMGGCRKTWQQIKLSPLLGKLALDFVLENPLIQLRQAADLVPMVARNLAHPQHFIDPGMAIVHAPPTVDLLIDLKAKGTPAYILHGSRDRGVRPATAQSTQEITGGRLEFIIGTGHAMPVSRVEDTAAAMTAMLWGRPLPKQMPLDPTLAAAELLASP